MREVSTHVLTDQLMERNVIFERQICNHNKY